ncbi:MAG: hypothetical protein UY35_C0008G0012 [Candidatus Saccharibacteria bacterium GW2011_GWC2_48_9]|nr:MAG: hypothetical protein UY35_C0008G0012 [Candidatus Saccharibacteria bacterium GW2011_GWC2_48_9]
MIIYETFQLFWNDYTKESVNKHGFKDWQVVNIHHTSDADYALQYHSGNDDLGFQPLVITEANPFSHEVRQTLVKHVADAVADSFTEYSRRKYSNSFDKKFGSFKPDTFKAFAEYDDWDSFYYAWLERARQPVFHMNIPLLIDHTPQIEYWTRKQSGQEILPYQRLLITTYFVTENRFFDFFIKNITDGQAQQIHQMTQSRIGLNLELLYTKKTPAHVRI